MCYEPRNEEFAKVCRERDELKAAYDGAKLAMKALNEKLVQVTAERDELKRELEETKELLEAAKSAQGLLQIHLVKVQEERDALKKIVAGGLDACDYCEHEIEGKCGNTYGCVECMERCVCGTCNGGSAFELRKREEE